MVVTAPPPVRGFIKRQDFVEMSLLESIHGVAVRPNSDDVTAEVAPDKIILGRPGGLTLSSADVARRARADRGAADFRCRANGARTRQENFIARERRADRPRRRPPSPISARRRGSIWPASIMARGMYPEAKGVARSGAGRRQAGPGRSGRADRAFGREHPDGPSRAGAEGPRQSRDRNQLRFAAVEGAGLCARRANGRRRGRNSRTSNSPSPRCRSTCSAS